jgi:hypothetical protein
MEKIFCILVELLVISFIIIVLEKVSKVLLLVFLGGFGKIYIYHIHQIT